MQKKCLNVAHIIGRVIFSFILSLFFLSGCAPTFKLNSTQDLDKMKVRTRETELRHSFSGEKICDDLVSYKDSLDDASSALIKCIGGAEEGNILKVPPGRYYLARRVNINKRLLLTTEGLSSADPQCAADGGARCAEFVISPDFNDEAGMLHLAAPGAGIDHLVLNGNRQNREKTEAANSCRQGKNRKGFNMNLECPHCFVTNSVSKFTLCGTGLEVTGHQPYLLLSKNTFAYNGRHEIKGLWSDGLTVHDSANSLIVDNKFVDNTDIDLVLGGCQNCVIQNNRITHSESYQASSFAAFHIQSWPNGTSGNYTQSDISGNFIDCGPKRRCGFGLYVGGEAWYPSTVFGGSIHDNFVTRAQLGVNVDKTTGTVEFYNNRATDSGGGTQAQCGFRQTGNYNIAPGSQLDRKKDSVPSSSYTRDQWEKCVPNYHDYVAAQAAHQSPASLDDPFAGFPNSGRLESGAELSIGQGLRSPNRQFTLFVQEDGNIVLYNLAMKSLWDSKTSGSRVRLVMQPDSNLVAYSETGVALWNSRTAGRPGAWLNVQDDGNLVIYSSANEPLWSRFKANIGSGNNGTANQNPIAQPNPSPAPPAEVIAANRPSNPNSDPFGSLSNSGRINAGSILDIGQGVRSPNGKYALIVQGDGNVVMYHNTMKVLWSSRTSGASVRLAMQDDGNVVVYSAAGAALWNSRTAGKPGAWLNVQDDGNLVIYSATNTALWSRLAGKL